MIRLLIAAGLVVSTYASADVRKGIATCASIDGELSRLECYDKLAKAEELDGPQPTDNNSIDSNSQWEVKETINPIDDTKTTTLTASSVSGTNRRGIPVILMIRCKSSETDLVVSWSDYMGSDLNVLLRIDNQRAFTMSWNMSTNNSAGFFPGSPITFLHQMIKGNRLVIQATPYNESPITAIFSLAGLTKAIAPLRANCGW